MQQTIPKQRSMQLQLKNISHKNTSKNCSKSIHEKIPNSY